MPASTQKCFHVNKSAEWQSLVAYGLILCVVFEEDLKLLGRRKLPRYAMHNLGVLEANNLGISLDAILSSVRSFLFATLAEDHNFQFGVGARHRRAASQTR